MDRPLDHSPSPASTGSGRLCSAVSCGRPAPLPKRGVLPSTNSHSRPQTVVLLSASFPTSSPFPSPLPRTRGCLPTVAVSTAGTWPGPPLDTNRSAWKELCKRAVQPARRAGGVGFDTWQAGFDRRMISARNSSSSSVSEPRALPLASLARGPVHRHCVRSAAVGRFEGRASN